MKNKYILIFSIICGLLTAYLIYDYLLDVGRAADNTQYGEVIVAAVDIAEKTQLTNEMLQVLQLPVDYIHPLAVRTKKEAVGTIADSDLLQGEQVLQKKLAVIGGTQHGFSYTIPMNKRAITVIVDEVSGISGFIKPGDHVDVAAVVNLPDLALQKETPQGLIVLQNILVLAVGKTLEAGMAGKETLEYKNVTLAVTVEEARPLMLASQKGDIRLLLRSPVDNSIYQTVPFKPADFLR